MKNTISSMHKLNIAFAWQTLTSENLGVCALAQSQIAIVQEVAEDLGIELKFMEFCPIGPKVDLAKDLGCELADPLSPKKILLGKSKYIQQLQSCDLVLDIGAGDSFSDIYGSKHFIFICLSKLLALLLKKPLVLSPQTIGPFQKTWSQIIAIFIMKRSRKVFARDGLSMQFLNDLNIKNNTLEAIDVAFALPYEKRQNTSKGVIKVGINISGLLMNGGYTRNNQFGLTVNYEVLIYKVIEYFIAQPNIEIHLVAHVLSDSIPVEDDYAINSALKEKYPNTIIAPRFFSPSEAKSYISELDFFTGARMHACIAAFSSGVPVVPMAYSRKFNGLFGSLGYHSIADLKFHDTNIAYSKIIDGFINRNLLKIEIEKGNSLAHEKLKNYKNYLSDLFQNLISKKYV